MKLNLRRCEHIRKLGDPQQQMLQVLLEEFTLTKEERGRLLDVHVSEDSWSLSSKEGKSELHKKVARSRIKGQQELERKLSAFSRQKDVLSFHFDCESHPVRYANGGVLPVIRIESKDYFCLFLRDIDPLGWNIANGASDDTEEMLDPQRIIHREFGEELFICDHRTKKLYLFDPGTGMAPAGFQSEALREWDRRLSRRRFRDYERLTIPLFWLAGPDRVRATVLGQERVTAGYFLSITPEDNAIEVDRVARINMRGDISLLDGECSKGTVLDRVIGLFEVKTLLKNLNKHDHRPQLVFHGGVKGDAQDLVKLAGNYARRLEQRKVREHGFGKQYQRKRRRFDLCPITRSIISRYAEWEKDDANRERPVPIAPATETVTDPSECDVFISFRSAVTEEARGLYEHLFRRGSRTFFSAVTLKRRGVSAYCDAIDKALQAAHCLIVVGTEPEHFTRGWVSYEWRSFLNEIHSGRKEKTDERPEGRIFVLSGGVAAVDLPFALRTCQIIPYSPASPQDSFEEVAKYIMPARNSVPG